MTRKLRPTEPYGLEPRVIEKASWVLGITNVHNVRGLGKEEKLVIGGGRVGTKPLPPFASNSR